MSTRVAAVAAILLGVLCPAAVVHAQDGAALYRAHCASCHDAGTPRVPTRDVIAALPVERIVDALSTGLMRVQGEPLTPAERRAIAVTISTAAPVSPSSGSGRACAPATAPVPAPRAGDWNGWGVDLSSDRFQREPGLMPEQVPHLALKWAFEVWETHPPRCGDNCTSSQSAPAAVIPGVVFSGSLDGHMRAYATSDGSIVWDIDTAREFTTVNGVKATGGSIDVGGPAIADGMLLTTSGYGTWGGKRGNVLLAFGVDR